MPRRPIHRQVSKKVIAQVQRRAAGTRRYRSRLGARRLLPETGFDIIDNVLEWAEPHQMYVILDMHAAPGGQGRNSEISMKFGF